MGNKALSPSSHRGHQYSCPVHNKNITISPKKAKIHHIKLKYSSEEIELLQAFLKDIYQPHLRPSTNHDLQLVLHHWQRLHFLYECDARQKQAEQQQPVAPIGQLFDMYHKFLNEFVPDSFHLFQNSKRFQGRALLDSVNGILNLLQSANPVEIAQRVAKSHVAYGVKSGDFNGLGLALLHTLSEIGPTLWTDYVASAWKAVFCHASVLVLYQMEALPSPTPRDNETNMQSTPHLLDQSSTDEVDRNTNFQDLWQYNSCSDPDLVTMNSSLATTTTTKSRGDNKVRMPSQVAQVSNQSLWDSNALNPTLSIPTHQPHQRVSVQKIESRPGRSKSSTN